MATLLEHPTLKKMKAEKLKKENQKKNISAKDYSKAFKKWEPPSFKRPDVKSKVSQPQEDAIEEFLAEILPEGSPLSGNPLFIKAVQRRLIDQDDD